MLFSIQPGFIMYDRQTAQTQRISLDSNGNQTGGGSHPKISDDGRYVLFTSSASDLVPDDTNNAVDVFVRDLQTGQTKRVSVDSNGNQLMNASQTPITLGQDISPDGRYILFESNADNLVPNDTNNQLDVFRHDTLTGETILISVNSNGVQANGDSGGSRISDDGRFVYFQSVATNLVVNDTNNVADVFKRDTQNNTTTRLGEIQTNGESGTISTASDYVVFSSDATNLVSNDTNNATDIFAYHNQFRTFRRLVAPPYMGIVREPNDVSYQPNISNDGRYVVFVSRATNLFQWNNAPRSFDEYNMQTRFFCMIVYQNKCGKSRISQVITYYIPHLYQVIIGILYL